MASIPAGPIQTDSCSPRLTETEERVARKLVADHRARLDWLLRVPEWEPLLAEGLAALGLPGRRQGVGFAAAVGALALEHKHELVRWVIPRFRRHLPAATGQRMCRVLGLEPFDELELEQMLAVRQWQDLSRRALFKLGHDHRAYKQAQHLLFIGFRHLVDRMAAQIVYAPAHEADCRQEGCLGLLHAIDRADAATPGFAAFAIAWIRRGMRNYLMRQKLPVHAPVNLVSRVSLRRSSEPEPGPDGAAARAETLLLECLRHPTVSLDEPAAEGGASVAEGVADRDAESPAEAAARADARAVVGRMLGRLTGKQREVLARRFGFEGAAASSLAEISRAIGISHQQAGMRERRALERLDAALAPLAAELTGRRREPAPCPASAGKPHPSRGPARAEGPRA
jgi:RNA polymerase sigma factor (sigma-70 family)